MNDTFKVTDRFNLCGKVPKSHLAEVVDAIERVPDSIDMSDHRNLDHAIAGNFKRKVRQNFQPFKECEFNCDIAIKKLGMLIEIEKGMGPRLELDILKFQAAFQKAKWNYGVLIVPSTHIKLKLQGSNSPVEYLRRLKTMIGDFDMNIAVIGYEDPREPS